MIKPVYFLRPVGHLGPVKIGSSTNPLARLNAFRTWSPLPLELAATASCHHNTENWLHRFFISDWIHGEWFQWSEKLQEVIDVAVEFGHMPEWVKPHTNWLEYRAFLAEYPKGKTKMVTPMIFEAEPPA